MDYNIFSYVIRSKNRKKIILALDKMKLPSQLKKELKMEDSNIARALRELEKVSVVKCLTPKQKMGKLYVLTPLGEKVREELIS
ncbi:MAG: ArsR family transcriptional regulator [Nanoarchaeota archaeon]|nr:ArsR family transcriptional regulator [Nanoarchaeota archaeon]MCG2719611.1 ArsR family transcriptional regulator [Nanoarchaeota archaeon]